MNPDQILAIYRIDRKEHLERILDGKLRFRPLTVYREIEANQTHRFDSDEGLISIHHPTPGNDKAYLIAQNGPLAGLKVEFVLTGPVKVSANAGNTSILCFSKVIRSDFGELTAGSQYSYPMNPEMLKFGDHCLGITKVEEFIKRFKTKTDELGLKAGSGSVQYIDISDHDGDIKPIGFTKSKDSFSYQKEYRLMIAFSGDAPSEYILDIGSIRDIAVIQPLK